MIEAMKQALETAEGIANANWRTWDELASPEEFVRWAKARSLHTAINLRIAIEQAEKQKPLAWMYTSHWTGYEQYFTKYQTELSTYKADKVWPLYTTPPAAQREWVGLTVADIYEIADDYVFIGNIKEIAHAIEAKLKEKNT